MGSTAPAQAFDLNPPPRPGGVVEYFNTDTGHYFYTPHPGEQALIDGGTFGGGWQKTGLQFAAFATLESSRYFGSACDAASVACRPVTRFYGTPGVGPNSHFFTGFTGEAEILGQSGSGWSLEGVAFHIPLPDAAGACPATLIPVHRFYNDRWRVNDSNHRFVANAHARRLTRESGWVDEGVAFCAYNAASAPVDTASYRNEDPQAVISLTACRQSVRGACVGLDNLPLALTLFSGSLDLPFPSRDPFNARVGWAMPRGSILSTVATTREHAAANTFVYLSATGDLVGFNLNTANRGSAPLTSIVALAKGDASLYPFRDRYRTEYVLSLDFHVGLRALAAAIGSQAYGGSTVEFRDASSGRKFQFNAIAYGTGGDGIYVGPEARTGTPIVGMSVASLTPYATFEGAPLRAATDHSADRGQAYRIEVTREQFQAMVDAARGVDPSLSRDPRDYSVDSFGFVNEVFGDGAVAGWVLPPRVSVLPRS